MFFAFVQEDRLSRRDPLFGTVLAAYDPRAVEDGEDLRQVCGVPKQFATWREAKDRGLHERAFLEGGRQRRNSHAVKEIATRHERNVWGEAEPFHVVLLPELPDAQASQVGGSVSETKTAKTVAAVAARSVRSGALAANVTKTKAPICSPLGAVRQFR
jgi:hypothetical protein